MGRIMIAAILATLTVGCASAGPRDGDDALTMLRLAGSRESNPPRDGSESFVVDTLSVPAPEAFQALRGAYERLGIPFSYYAAEQLQLGGLIKRLDGFGEERPSTWVDCGSGLAATYADSYVVSLVIASRVKPLDSLRSTVESVIRARARANAVSGDLIRCRSLGTLEDRVAEQVSASVSP